MKSTHMKGYLFIIISAVIFGCMPLGAKVIYADGVNSITLVFLRNFLALPVLAVLAKKTGGTLAISRDALKEISLIALFGCCITPILLFTSYNYISSGTATVFHFIYPAATVLGSALFLREKVGRGPLVCILICTGGIALFYDPGEPINLFGSAVALLSGITYAAYIILLARCRHKEIAGFKFSFYVASVSSVVLFLVCVCSGQLRLPTRLSIWVISFVFSFALSVGAVVLFQMGTFFIGGQRAAILSTCEPITSLVVGYFAFHEAVGVRTLVGSFFVVLAAILIAVFDSKGEKKAAVQ